MTRITCPFEHCDAQVQLLTQRARSLGEPAVELIKEHTTFPGFWFGTCPASLFAYPLLPHEESILQSQAGAYESMQRAKDNREQPSPSAPAKVHPLTPRPNGNDHLFRADSGKAANGMTSVAEVRAMIDQAVVALAEGAALAQQAGERFAQGQALLHAIRSMQLGHDIGEPSAAAAQQHTTDAALAARNAMETATAYGAQL